MVKQKPTETDIFTANEMSLQLPESLHEELLRSHPAWEALCEQLPSPIRSLLIRILRRCVKFGGDAHGCRVIIYGMLDPYKRKNPEAVEGINDEVIDALILDVNPEPRAPASEQQGYNPKHTCWISWKDSIKSSKQLDESVKVDLLELLARMYQRCCSVPNTLSYNDLREVFITGEIVCAQQGSSLMAQFVNVLHDLEKDFNVSILASNLG